MTYDTEKIVVKKIHSETASKFHKQLQRNSKLHYIKYYFKVDKFWSRNT